MQVLDSYINFVRPVVKPQCEFVLVKTNGGQHSKLGDVISKLVFDAIGKNIHPTRYRQIVETQSLNQLTRKEQRIFLEDHKHGSAHYQKQRSREVAAMAHECLQKLQGTKGSEVDKEVHARFGCSTSSSSPSVETAERTIMPPKRVVSSTTHLRIQRSHRRILKFTADEDKFLKEGIDKHGLGQWSAILRDSELKFQGGRMAGSLKKMAELKFMLKKELH